MSNQRWPSAHEVYRGYLEKPKLAKMLAGTSGALVIENEFGGQIGYELRTLGSSSSEAEFGLLSGDSC